MDGGNRIRNFSRSSSKLLIALLLCMVREDVEGRSPVRFFVSQQAGVRLGNVTQTTGSTITGTVRADPYPEKSFLFIHNNDKQILGKNEDDTDTLLANLPSGQNIVDFVINEQFILIAETGKPCFHSFYPEEVSSRDVIPCTATLDSELQSIDMIEPAFENSMAEFILFSKISSEVWTLTHRKKRTDKVKRIAEFNKTKFGVPTYMTADPLGKDIYFTTRTGVWACKEQNCTSPKAILPSNNTLPIYDGEFRTANAKKVEQILFVNPYLIFIADKGSESIRIVNLKYEVINSICQDIENNPSFIAGEQNVCQLVNPERMVIHEKSQSILIFGAERYKLSYTRFIFTPPSTAAPTRDAAPVNIIIGVTVAFFVVGGVGLTLVILLIKKTSKVKKARNAKKNTTPSKNPKKAKEDIVVALQH